MQESRRIDILARFLLLSSTATRTTTRRVAFANGGLSGTARKAPDRFVCASHQAHLLAETEEIGAFSASFTVHEICKTVSLLVLSIFCKKSAAFVLERIHRVRQALI